MVGTMLAVNSYVPRSTLLAAISRLERREGVSHVIQVGDTPDGEMTLVTADVAEDSVDGVLADLSECGVSGEEIELVHRQGNRPLATRRGAGGTPAWGGGIAWSELTTASRQYARAVPRYLVIMVCAGVIAVFGVLSRNTILVVGAMAVSPDLLPMCAACVGLADRRPRLAARALGTLVAGLVVAGAAAFVVATLLRLGDYPQAIAPLGDGGLGVLPHVNIATISVAFVAGVAGVLAFETRSSSAVGVAISITTIPAVAFMGGAIALHDGRGAWSGLAVLVANVLVLLVAGTLTVWLQRKARRVRR